MTDIKIKDGYAKHKGRTVKELNEILSELEKQGYGDYEVAFGFDSNYVYTTTDGAYEIEDGTIWFEEQDF